MKRKSYINLPTMADERIFQPVYSLTLIDCGVSSSAPPRHLLLLLLLLLSLSSCSNQTVKESSSPFSYLISYNTLQVSSSAPCTLAILYLYFFLTAYHSCLYVFLHYRVITMSNSYSQVSSSAPCFRPIRSFLVLCPEYQFFSHNLCCIMLLYQFLSSLCNRYTWVTSSVPLFCYYSHLSILICCNHIRETSSGPRFRYLFPYRYRYSLRARYSVSGCSAVDSLSFICTGVVSRDPLLSLYPPRLRRYINGCSAVSPDLKLCFLFLIEPIARTVSSSAPPSMLPHTDLVMYFSHSMKTMTARTTLQLHTTSVNNRQQY